MVYSTKLMFVCALNKICSLRNRVNLNNCHSEQKINQKIIKTY